MSRTSATAPPGGHASTFAASYPAAPWRLRGSAVIVPVPLKPAAARRFLPPDVKLVAPVGGVLLANYDDTATLSYRELIVFSGLVRAGARVGMWVSHIWVDLPESVAGGRAIWGLPKELAPSVAPFLRARVRPPRLRATLPLTPACFGRRADDGALLWTASRGTLRGGPALVTLDVPDDSPLKPLGLDGTWPGVAGDRLDLPFPAPRALP